MDRKGGEAYLGRVKHLKNRQNELMRMYLVVLSMLLVSYFFGLLGFSMAWVFIVAFITFLVWRRRVIYMNEEFLREQEQCVQKKRALNNYESCEWLNFVVNRWFAFASRNISAVFKTKVDIFLDILKPYFLNSLNFKTFQPHSGTLQLKEVTSYEVFQGKVPTSTCLATAQKYRVVLEATVHLQYQQLMILSAGLSGKWSGLSMDAAIEKFSLHGRVQVLLHMDKDIAFPHFSSCTVSFIKKPELHFGIRVLKHIQLMEVPFLKMWLHSLISNTILDAFVDPGKLELSLVDGEGVVGRPFSEPGPVVLAEGVVTVRIHGSLKPSKDKKSKKPSSDFLNEQKYCEISLGKQHYTSLPPPSSSPLNLPSSPIHSPSSFAPSSLSAETTFKCAATFLVHDLDHESLKVEMKSRLFLSNLSLACVHLPLSSFDLSHKLKGSTTLNEAVEQSNEKLSLEVQLEYTGMQDVLLQVQMGIKPDLPQDTQSGVLSVCMHGASDLPGMDNDGRSDPYCVLYCTGKKISCSHYVARTRNPSWECWSQLIVEDISKVVLSFVVYDWDGVSTSDDDFLGSAHVSMNQTTHPIMHQCFPLLLTHSATQHPSNDVIKRGTIIISILFTPVPHIPTQTPDNELTAAEQRQVASSMSQPNKLLKSPNGIVQLNVIQASNLLAKDRNGLSDPFFEVLIGRDKKFTSDVIKKTLNPVWNEECHVEMPSKLQKLQIVVWDHDMLSKNDFLGRVYLSRQRLLSLASDPQFDGWLKLEEVEQGSIQVSLKVFAQEEGDGDGVDGDIGGGGGVGDIDSSGVDGGGGDRDGTVGLLSSNAKTVGIGASRQESKSSGRGSFQRRPIFELDSPDCSFYLENDKVTSVTTANDSLISSKIEEFDNEFKRSTSRLNLHYLEGSVYKGVVMEVIRLEGLTASSRHACLKIKISSAVEGGSRELACSPAFIINQSVPLHLRFQVDGEGGERRESSLSFKLKAGRFRLICKMVVVLADILPSEEKQTRRSVLNQDGVRLHVTCSFKSVHRP